MDAIIRVRCSALRAQWVPMTGDDVLNPVCTGCNRRVLKGAQQTRELNVTRRPPCGSLEDFLGDILGASLEAGTSPNPAPKALHCPHTRQEYCQAPANVVSWALSQRGAGPCRLANGADHRERSRPSLLLPPAGGWMVAQAS